MGVISRFLMSVGFLALVPPMVLAEVYEYRGNRGTLYRVDLADLSDALGSNVKDRMDKISQDFLAQASGCIAEVDKAKLEIALNKFNDKVSGHAQSLKSIIDNHINTIAWNQGSDVYDDGRQNVMYYNLNKVCSKDSLSMIEKKTRENLTVITKVYERVSEITSGLSKERLELEAVIKDVEGRILPLSSRLVSCPFSSSFTTAKARLFENDNKVRYSNRSLSSNINYYLMEASGIITEKLDGEKRYLDKDYLGGKLKQQPDECAKLKNKKPDYSKADAFVPESSFPNDADSAQ